MDTILNIDKNNIRFPDGFSYGDHVAIDLGFYSTIGKLTIGNWVHIAPYCSFIGGKPAEIIIGNYVGIAPYCLFVGSMDSYKDGFMNAVIPEEYRNIHTEPIKLEDYVGIASYVVVTPGVTIPEGVTIGAHSLVRKTDVLKPWTLYAGSPLREICSRKSDAKENTPMLSHWLNKTTKKEL